MLEREVRTRWVVLAGIALVVALAAACSSSDPVETSVRPFEEVQASPIAFEGDPSDPSRGIFRVTTSEPMICAIVWGEDESFGRFNNSLAMNGTGITQHDVALPDVVPGTTYRYVIQGTTADGTLYRSDVGSFTIDGSVSTTTPVDRGENLAAGATVSAVSSEFSAQFGGANAIDGDLDTEWATQGDGDDGFIEVDLGDTTEIGGVEFLTRSMADGSAITDTFTVIAADGTTFGPFPAGTIADPRFAAIATSSRTLRFEIASSTGGNVGAVEIRVYGPQG